MLYIHIVNKITVMKFLLPHSYKIFGAVAPLGLAFLLSYIGRFKYILLVKLSQ